MLQLAHLASLSGAEFEIAFMEMMIEHLPGRSRRLGSAWTKPPMGHYITRARTLSRPRAEISQLLTWLCAWYGIRKKE